MDSSSNSRNAENEAQHSEKLECPSQPSTKMNFEIPRGVSDCLTHIYGDSQRFPMAPGRTYTPELASIAEIEALHRALHIDRVIIVQPTLYGTDNSCTIDAIRQLGSSARGIAVVDALTPAAALDEMADAGICGIRINLETIGLTDPGVARDRLRFAIEQVRNRTNWHIEMYTRLPIIEAIYDLLVASPVPVVLDHFAGVKASHGVDEPAFARVIDLLKAGKVYVKFTGPYLASKLGPDFPDLVTVARAFVEANARRILWGTNWPHPNAIPVKGRKNTDIAPLRRVDDGHLLNLLPTWAPDVADRKAILVDNPAELYGF